MVSISQETAEETHARLRTVLGQAELTVLDGVWRFVESPLDQPPALDRDTLAVVRDEQTWSALRPDDGGPGERERFGLVSFHFPAGLDNSGFVAWLAGELKARLGTGVFVVCGSNRGRGGIYDYWGCPVELVDEVVAVIHALAVPDPSTTTPAYIWGESFMVLLVIGVVLVLAALVNLLLGHATAALVTGVVGLVLVLVWLFRRYGRPGDFNRSGTTGIQ